MCLSLLYTLLNNIIYKYSSDNDDKYKTEHIWLEVFLRSHFCFAIFDLHSALREGMVKG